MDDVAEKIIAIVRDNSRQPDREIAADTKLADLEIKSLDLTVILFDIEDAFQIQIHYDPGAEASDLETVGAVISRVKSVLAGTGDVSKETA